MTASPRKPTNLSLDAALLQEARALDVNLSRAAEAGLRDAVTRARHETWRRDNATAVDSANDWVERNGLPLSRYRQF